MQYDDTLFIQLRDCFYGGYSMPQYCIDAGIRRPLFIAFRSDWLWEIYVQCRYDKRLQPEFILLNNGNISINYSVACVLNALELNKAVDIKNFDRIIVLTTARFVQMPDAIYLDILVNKFSAHVYAGKPLYSYLKHHPDVKIIVTNTPLLISNPHSTDYEKKILSADDIHSLRRRLEQNKGTQIETRFDMFGYTNEQVLSLLQMSGANTNLDGSTSLIDSDDELINIREGKRMTAYQPANYDHTIYFMGTCTYFGIGTPYNKTLESYLQKLLNENGFRYKVENASQFFAGRYQDIFYNLNRLPVESGDIIFMCLQGLAPERIPFFNVENVFTRPHNFGEVFSDVNHINENGYRALAQIFFGLLVQNSFFANLKYELPTVEEPHNYGILPPPLQIIFRRQPASACNRMTA